MTLICPTRRTLRPCRVGDKKEKGDSGVDSREGQKLRKITSESRRSAHALKGWGAVSDPPCAGRPSPEEYGPVRRCRPGRESNKL